QAVAFARIRKIDSDNARADRQQQVLKAIFQKIQTMPKTDYPRFIKEFLSIAETSLNYSDLFGLSPIMLNGNLAIEQYQVPDENEAPWGGTDTDGVWYWKYDLNAAANRIHTIIYGAGDASTATPN
ncbi:MAG: LCP family protein, partial [Clostridiales bacterium]